MQVSLRKYFYGAALMACIPLVSAGIPGSSIDQATMQKLRDKIKELGATIAVGAKPEPWSYDNGSLKRQGEYLKLLEELDKDGSHRLELKSSSGGLTITEGEDKAGKLPLSGYAFSLSTPAERCPEKYAAIKFRYAMKKQLTPVMANYFYMRQWIHNNTQGQASSIEQIESIRELDIFKNHSIQTSRLLGKLEDDAIETLKNTPTENIAEYQFDMLKELPGLMPMDILGFTHLVAAKRKLIPETCGEVSSTDTFDGLNGFSNNLLHILHFASAEPIKISKLNFRKRSDISFMFLHSGQGNNNGLYEAGKAPASQENKKALNEFMRMNQALGNKGGEQLTAYFTVEKGHDNESGGQSIMLSTHGSQLTVALNLNEGLLLAYQIPEENNAAFLANLMGFLSPAYAIHNYEDKDDIDGDVHFSFKANMHPFWENISDAAVGEEDGLKGNKNYDSAYSAKRVSCCCPGSVFSGCRYICSLMASGVTYPLSKIKTWMEADRTQ